MAVIKKYTKKDGTTAYQFNAYLGIDPATGKPKRTTRRGFKTQKEAKLALSRLEIDVDTHGLQIRSYGTFNEVYDVWFKQYKTTVKPITAAHTERMFRLHILPELGHIKIDKITKFLCQKVVNEWSENYSAFHLLKSITQKMLNYAVSQDILITNPMQYVIMPKRTPKNESKKTKFLELSELKTFLIHAKKTLKYQDYLMFRVLAFTGLRKGELYALTWSDVNFVEKTIIINKTLVTVNRQSMITDPKTKHSNRIIQLDDVTFAEINSWYKYQKEYLFSVGKRTKKPDEQLLFHNKENKLLYVEYLNRLLENTLKTKLTPHSFRHTHASLLFEAGATMKEVQVRLGHSDINTTMNVYAHVTKVASKEAINKLSSYANF